MFGADSPDSNLAFSTWKADVMPLYDVRICNKNKAHFGKCIDTIIGL